jgi:hypothetical protein
MTETPKQLWQHLLCAQCEARLNKYGEATTLSLLYRVESFTLLERMNLSLRLRIDDPAIVYSGSDMGIDTEHLAHFALGLLWKGSVTSWNTLQGQSTSISLGKYQESIQNYLVGRSEFPSDIYVIVTVCTDLGSKGMIFAPWKIDVPRDQYSLFEILIRGLWFRIAMGTNVPAGLKDLCCLQSTKKVLFMADCNKEFLKAGKHFFETADDQVNTSRRPDVLKRKLV